MPRVKGGTVTRRRRKKILKLAKGYFGSKRTLYRTAHEQVMRSLAYAYRDRKQRKRQFRKLWISRINAGAKLNGMKYSTLIHGLALAGVTVNRKMLSDIAIHEPADFTQYCTVAKQALEGNVLEQVKVNAAATSDDSQPADYSGMLVKELRELAEARAIDGAKSMLKADLVKALEESDKQA
jgi:large subunit ribosomal protein L20